MGDRFDRTAVTAGDLEAAGAMTLLLRDAIRPNLVQTLEHSPAFIHGGPFANIAQGTNSLLATSQSQITGVKPLWGNRNKGLSCKALFFRKGTHGGL